jgi:hypothetical protein
MDPDTTEFCSIISWALRSAVSDGPSRRTRNGHLGPIEWGTRGQAFWATALSDPTAEIIRIGGYVNMIADGLERALVLAWATVARTRS